MTLKQTKQRGFTIVELLIVVVIIAILAAITIVAYNGIQNRAKTSAAAGAASTLQKKVEAYAVENTTFPTAANTLTTATADKTWNLPQDAVVFNTSSTALSNSTDPAKTVKYYACTGGTGYQIEYWAYDGGGLKTITGGTGTCATLVAL